MPGAGDIKAGRAYVELLLKDGAFQKGLKNASRNLQAFGGGILKFGAGISAAAGAATGIMTLATKRFADFGSELNDMSARTGIAGSVLAELGYAAEQTGASMDDVEGAVRKMQKFLGSGATASESTRKALHELGLTFSQLKGQTPDQQFQAIADKIAAIPDPSRRAAAAMEVFGKKGTQILPMLEELASLRGEARDFGLVPSDDAIKKADELGDAFGKVQAVARAIAFEVGAALAPAVLDVTSQIAEAARAASMFVRQNSGLIVSLGKIAAVTTAAGVAITGIGGALWGLGAVLGKVSWGIGIIKVGIAALTSPFTLVAAAIGAGVFAWTQWTESGQQALTVASGILGNLWSIFQRVFAGISDAIMGGNLSLAVQIAMTGVQLAFAQGWQFIVSGWQAALESLKTGFPGLTSAFADAVATIRSAFAVMVDGNESSWQGMIAFMAQSLALLTSNAKSVLNEFVGWLEKTWDWATTGLGEEQQKALATRNKIRDRVTSGANDILQGQLNDQMTNLMGGSNQQRLQEQLQQIEADRAKATTPAGQKAAEQQVNPQIEGLKAQLAQLQAQAAQEGEQRKLDLAAGMKDANAGHPAAVGGPVQQAVSTFSASALAALGNGGTQDAIAEATKGTWEELKQARREAFLARHREGVFGA